MVIVLCDVTANIRVHPDLLHLSMEYAYRISAEDPSLSCVQRNLTQVNVTCVVERLCLSAVLHGHFGGAQIYLYVCAH